MIYENEIHDEERSFYGLKDATVRNCKIDGLADGESAFKECKDITVENTYFNLRYPFWHNDNVTITDCEMTENCRAALWYDNGVVIDNCKLHGIKALRECGDILLKNTDIISPEFAWRSRNITIENVKLKGEYLAWYAENIRFVRCKIIGTQPLCYVKGLVLEECEMEGCDLSFERSEVEATVRGHIDSVKNPICGHIIADSIGEIILEEEIVEIGACKIQAGA